MSIALKVTGIIVGGFVVGVFMVSASNSGKPSKYASRSVLERALKDPDSAEYMNDHLADLGPKGIFYCGQVNAKNAFGGYVGFRRFVVKNEIEILIDNPEDAMKHAQFGIQWTEGCL